MMPILPDGFTYELPEAVDWPTDNIRRVPDVTIDHTLGQPSAARFDAGEDTDTDVAPQVGESVELNFGTSLLKGQIELTTQTFEDRRDQLKWSAQVTDTTRKFNKRLPIVCYTAVSATTVITNLLTTYASDFTTTFVQAALPNVTVTFDGSKTLYQCLEEIASQLGNTHFYLDGFDLHFFTGVDPTGAPATIDENNEDLLHDPPVQYTEDMTQLRTRVFGKGAGAKLIADLHAGDDIIFVDSNDLFDDSGGDLFVNPCQVIHYTGKRIVSVPQYRANLTGAFSATQDILTPVAGQAYGHPDPNYFQSKIYYVVTQVRNGVESNGAMINIAPVSNAPPLLTGLAEAGGGSLENGITYTYYAALVDVNGHETELPPGIGNNVTVNSPFSAVTGTAITAIGGTDARSAAIRIYRFAHSGPYANRFFKVLDIDITGDPGGTSYNWIDGYSSTSLTGRRTDVEEAILNGYTVVGRNGSKVTLTVPLGPTGTTARRIYRSDDNAVSFYLLTTINDNTTTSYDDSAPPGNGDWLLFDGFGSFNWVDSPITPNQLPTDLPDLKKAVLTGVTGVTEDAPAGTDVNLWVQRDDTDAQGEIALIEGGDGVHEYLLTDTTLDSKAKLEARADIELELYARPLKSVRYATRDRESKVGRTVTFDLPAGGSGKGVFGTFLIQQVTVDQIHENDTLVERYTVSASGARFTLQDLLQRVALLQDNGSTPTTGFTGGGGGGGNVTTQVTEAELNLSDVTTGDVSTSKHGLAPKLSGSSGTFLNGNGLYAPPGMERVLSINTLVAAGTSAVVSESLEIGAGLSLEIGAGALLEVLGSPQLFVPTLYTPPNDSLFSWVNAGGATIVAANNKIFLRAPVSATNNFRIRKVTAPATPWTLTAAFQGNLVNLSSQNFGLCFRQSSDGKLHGFFVNGSTNAGGANQASGLFSTKFTNPTTFSADYQTRGFNRSGDVTWLRVSDDGVNRVCSFSADGVNFITFTTIGRTDFLTADEVGWFANDASNTYEVGVTLLSWLFS